MHGIGRSCVQCSKRHGLNVALGCSYTGRQFNFSVDLLLALLFRSPVGQKHEAVLD